MDAWADLDIPDFLKVANRVPRENPYRSLKGANKPEAQKRAFHLPKTIEPEGLKLLKAAEREAERKKAERLEVLKALPKKPRRTRRHVKPPKRSQKRELGKPQSRSGAAKQPSARTRKPAPSSRSPRERSGARQRD